MSLVRFDPSIVTAKQWCIVSQIVGCPVILRQTGFLFLKVIIEDTTAHLVGSTPTIPLSTGLVTH